MWLAARCVGLARSACNLPSPKHVGRHFFFTPPFTLLHRMASSNPPGGISGLDRKAMEEERLARQAARKKRERSISPPVRSPRKAPKRTEDSSTATNASGMSGLSKMVQEDQQSRKPDIANAAVAQMKAGPSSTTNESGPSSVQTPANPESMPQGSIKYPNGVVKKTWAFGHERTGTDIKLEEVLEPNSVRTAVLSAYQWDDQWVLSKLKTPLNGGETKVLFVMQVKEPEERAQLRQEAEKSKSFLRLCLPSMSGLINCMHSKLMLLFHRQKLRIAIPTANLLNFDWGETGQMENSVFMIDLPRRESTTKQTTEDLTFFGQELMYFLGKQDMPQDVRDGVLKFDFTATKDMAFVHTVGGVHYREQAFRTGLLGLSHAVRQLGLTSEANLEIDFAASSIGTLNEKYLQDLYAAAQGKDFVQLARDMKAQAGADFFKKGAKKKSGQSNAALDKLRVYFPTKETVRASTAGAAGTICLKRSYFEAKTFPKDVFRDYKSTRQGLLSHNKILCARGKQDSKQVAWVYVGSANMSKSAWGELPTDRTEKRITCRNWECGVLLPVIKPTAEKTTSRGQEGHEDSETEDEDDDDAASEVEIPDISVFKDLVDLPFQIPGDKYNGREPWYFTEKQD